MFGFTKVPGTIAPGTILLSSSSRHNSEYCTARSAVLRSNCRAPVLVALSSTVVYSTITHNVVLLALPCYRYSVQFTFTTVHRSKKCSSAQTIVELKYNNTVVLDYFNTGTAHSSFTMCTYDSLLE
jgi:hypothetical protein